MSDQQQADPSTTPPAAEPANSGPSAEGTGTSEGKPNGDTTGGDGTDWRGHARTWEKRAEQNKNAAEQAEAKRKAAEEKLAAMLKAAGMGQDDDPAEALKRTATERDSIASERDQALADLRQERLERAAERAARKHGADPDALLDSRAFTTRLAEVDPASKTFTDDLDALVKAALKDSPSLRAATVPARTVRDSTGTGEPAREPSPGLDRMRSAYSQSPHQLRR